MSPSFNLFIEQVKKTSEDLFKPTLFKLSDAHDIGVFYRVINEHTFITKTDHLEFQIRELLKLKNPNKVLTNEEYLEGITAYYNSNPTEMAGIWCYFPWSKNLVHLLDEEDFIAVRTNRNQLKIRSEEQQLLKTKSIGVIGLSVGQAIAITAVMERICGKIKLADFDSIDLSNLNRLRTGIHNLGKSKVILAAREIAEIDPFIEVEIHKEGITSSNIDDFIGNLSVLVEVCDDMPTKINSRIVARKNKIPVVMDTNDRGMVDVERFDLEPQRPILHGYVNEEQLTNLKNLTPNERMDLVMKIVSFESTSPRLKESMQQIGKTITTWPQLASSIMLGAGATVDCCRRILLNQSTASGRYYIDLDQLVP